MIKQLFCDHDYVEVSKTETLSPYEQITKSGKQLNSCDGISATFRKLVIYVFKCQKCDKSIMRVVDNTGMVTSSIDIS